jgi:pyrrolysine biosynthesis protein PylC
MKIAILGGKLQGVEAAYLAGKTGWEATVIDFNSDAPARGLCSEFIQTEISSTEQLNSLLKPFDLVLPALENDAVLSLLHTYTRQTTRPVLFDFEAYALSSSKVDSNRLFKDMQLSLPVPYPDCGFPVIIKPDRASGSQGVHIMNDIHQMDSYLATSKGGHVIQGFIEGPSYSLEVYGIPGKYYPLQITDLEMDRDYDCKRVLAPSDLPEGLVADLSKMAVDIAEAIELKGVMDIEVIRDGRILRILEIDARLPSQTPICVYTSTGANILSLLAGVYCESQNLDRPQSTTERGVIFEHIQVAPGELMVTGEHIMSSAGPLQLKTDFFGADEAITNQATGRSTWVATLIIKGSNRKSAWNKRQAIIADIMAFFDIELYLDPYPDSVPIKPGMNKK